MPNKRVALIKNGKISNVVVWDGEKEFNPPSFAKEELTGSMTQKIGATFDYATHNIVLDGNSLFYYYTSADIISMLATMGITSGNYINVSISGKDTQQLIAEAPAKVDALYDPIFVNKNVVVLCEGTNDITRHTLDAATAYAHIKSYGQARKAAGFKVVVMTITPRTIPAQNEAIRLSVNQMIRDALAADETWIDGIADVASDMIIGQTGQNTNTTYYADGLHFTPAGYPIISTYIKAGLLQALA